MLTVGQLRYYLSAQIKNVQFLIPKTADNKKIEEIEGSREGKKEENSSYYMYTVPVNGSVYDLLIGCQVDKIGIRDDNTLEILLDEYLVDFRN